MQFDWWTFGFQIVNLGVLVWLLSRFLFRPIARIIAERQAETDRALAGAEKAKADAAEAEAEAKAEADRTAAARLGVIEKARDEAHTQADAILKQAHEQADDTLNRARAEAKRIARDGRTAQLHRASELASRIAEKLVANLPADGRIAGYADRLREALKALDPEQAQALAGELAAMHIVAPRALSADELAAARAAIRDALHTDPPDRVTLDESLIAGLELHGQHGVVHNSLRHDLDRIAGAMADEAED